MLAFWSTRNQVHTLVYFIGGLLFCALFMNEEVVDFLTTKLYLNPILLGFFYMLVGYIGSEDEGDYYTIFFFGAAMVVFFLFKMLFKL